jgi:hypothetical protein
MTIISYIQLYYTGGKMKILSISTDIKEAWNELISAMNNIVYLILAVIFLVLAIVILAKIVKKESTRWPELCFWLLWIAVSGIGFVLNLHISVIFKAQTYIAIGTTIFIIARVIYLLVFYKDKK